LTVRPTQPTAIDSVVSPKLSEHAFKKILLLPPEAGLDAKHIDVAVVREKPIGYYMAKLEKLLLARGFEIISSEIVARADSEVQGQKGKLSAAEKAMILGQKTKADAVLILQSLSVASSAKYFLVDDDKTTEIEPGRVRHDEDEDHPLHADTEHCLHEVPYYELRIESKLLDAGTGTVLWVGSGRQTTIDSLRDSWIAEVDDDCELIEQSFLYTDELATEATLDRTANAMLERLVTPLAKVALAGKTVVDEVAKPVPPPPPPPAPPKEPEPKLKMAVVSSPHAALREGAGKRNPRLKDIPRKAKVEVLETMGEWIKVKIQDGTIGWMHESTLIINE
jgi:hypothetical protein